MDKLEVFGARKLKGHIKISGSKNASLPILAATILSNKKIHLSNIPKVKDIEDFDVSIEVKRVKELKSNFLNNYIYSIIVILILLIVAIFYFVSR